MFSKVARAIPVKSKSSAEVARAFENEIILNSGFKPVYVQCDKGKEFLGEFQTMLARYGIKFYTSENNDIKCAVVERFNRTLKEKIYKYITYKNSYRYIDVLPSIVESYNTTYHRSIGMAPNEVNVNNSQIVAERLYPPKPTKFKYKFHLNDTVRISIERMVFRKGYLGNWSEELFTITAKYPTVPVTYQVSDLNGQPVKGKFYEFEIQKVEKPADDYYTVEKILKTRKRSGRTEYYVKWLGYDDSFNSWTDSIRSQNVN